MDIFAPDAMCVQTSLLAQPSRIDIRRVRSPEFVASRMKILGSFGVVVVPVVVCLVV